jgi:CheY-like chemotaxis protein/HPt (histidine-containing phosphotransfer) domain-containing protein
MGGSISVTSIPGEGSCFSFSACFGCQKDLATNVSISNSLEGVIALIVDDNSVNRQLLSSFLARWNMTTHSVSNASSALDMLHQMSNSGNIPGVILTDTRLPDIDGWELSARIRQHQEYDSVRILIMPSTGIRGDAKRCRDLRIDGYLTKPVIMEELYDTLVAIISGKQQCDHLVTRHTICEKQAPCTILVVDDVEINRELLRANLEKYGHLITMAQNGREAVDWFSKSSFDLIFMDMQMPILDGYGAVKEIRDIERNKDLLRTPIVAMTAYAMQGDREKCLSADMDAYLSKPARASEIIATIKQLVPEKNDHVVQPELNEPVRIEQTSTIFNKDELLERLGGREEMFRRFLDMFHKNVAGYMDLLSAAIDLNDHEQVRIHAHSIKGAAANISAGQIRETAATIESQAMEGTIDEASSLFTQLKEDIAVFQNETSVF